MVWPLIMAPQNFEIAHAALQLVGSAARILHRQMRETGIAIGPLLHLTRQEIVGFTSTADRRGDVALALHAGPGDRQHRARDPGLIHGLQPHFAEIGKPRQ